MTAPTVAQLVDQVADELGHLHGAVPTSTSAMIDQSVAGAREAAADAGLDLDDPAVAETVLRVSWAIGMAVARMPDSAHHAIVQTAALGNLQGRVVALARWCATGNLAAAAAGALQLPSPPDPTAAPPSWLDRIRGRWSR